MKTVIWLILFFPYGLYRMWKYEPWANGVKVAVSLFFGVALIWALKNPPKPAETPAAEPLAFTQSNVEKVASRQLGGALIDKVELQSDAVTISYRTKEDYFMQGAGLEKTYISTAAKLFAAFEPLNRITLTSVQDGKTYRWSVSYSDFELYTKYSRESIAKFWHQFEQEFIYNKDKRLLLFERFLSR